jgi:hypothetical protein
MLRLIALLIGLMLFPATASATKLGWAPWPDTVNTVYVNVPTTGLDMVGDVTKDYVLVMPSTPVSPKPGAGCIRLDNAHMVKIIGGECLIPPQPFVYNSKTRRCLGFNNVTWWVHVEGFWCHGDVLDYAEYSGSNAAVTYENDRVEGVSARDEINFTDGHPDGVYVFGGAVPGARSVRIDRMTIETDYQAMFFAHWLTGAAAGQNYPITIKNSNLRGTPIPGTHLAQLLWRADALNPMSLTAVYLQPQMLGNGTQEPLIKAVKPSDVDPVVANRAYYNIDGSVAWPTAAHITGRVIGGLPPGGDFVPVGIAGTNYISPGYTY